jgi:hypothetical protein
MFHVPNKYRNHTDSHYGSDDSIGNSGLFIIPYQKKNMLEYRVLASDGMGWEHVSVSLSLIGRRWSYDVLRCPTWPEMCYIKSLFWDEEDCVIQYHPSKSEYVNRHPYVLHLWRPTDPNMQIPIPDKIMVG